MMDMGLGSDLEGLFEHTGRWQESENATVGQPVSIRRMASETEQPSLP